VTPSTDFRLARITARQLLALVLGVVALLVVALFLITTREMSTARERAAAETRRLESFKLADSLRQISDDLTRMARLYASTGEERYNRFYEEIVAIRDGTARRPRRWQGSFWDLVLAEGESAIEYGAPVSLIRLMRRASFTRRELAVLEAARRASKTLTIVERDAMRRARSAFETTADHAAAASPRPTPTTAASSTRPTIAARAGSPS